MDSTTWIYTKLLIGALLCGLMFFWNGRMFRKTVPIDPTNIYGSPRFFSAANGTAVLYFLLAGAGIALGVFTAAWASWIAVGIIALFIIRDIFLFQKSARAFAKLQDKERGSAAAQQANAMFRIIRTERIALMIYAALEGVLIVL